ncbi:glycosyltransferase [bacterium]|nr:glycosyltransferase [bacterium]
MLIYVLNRYPYYSQTFIRDEIEYFKRLTKTVVFSLNDFRHLPEMVPSSSRELSVLLKLGMRAITGSVSLRELLLSLYSIFFGIYLSKNISEDDILRVHLPKFNGLAALTAIMIKKSSMIPVFHSFALFTHNTFIKEICEKSKSVETISKYNVKKLTMFTKRKIALRRCGIDTEKIVPVKTIKRDYLIFVGRMHPTKGIVRLFRMLSDTAIPIKLVGGGNIRKYKKLAEKLNVSAEFTGILPHEDVLKLIKGSAGLILPAQIAPDGDRDGIPIVLMEAMAMGIPVIATALSGIPELVEKGVSGFLFNTVEEGRKVCLNVFNNGVPNSIISNARERVLSDFHAMANLKKKERDLL